MSVATVELAVAAASLLLSVGMALLVTRTLVRPLRRLQASMRRVERGRAGRHVRRDVVGRARTARDELRPLVEGLRREALVRDLFGQYVTPELAKAAIERRAELDGQLVTCTVLFADIRNFTGIAEALPARGCSRSSTSTSPECRPSSWRSTAS